MLLRPDVAALLAGAETVLLDVDGVLCLADDPIADATPVIAALCEVANVVVTTNDSRRGPEAQRSRVRAAGVPDNVPIISAVDAVVARLRAAGIQRVIGVGTDGLREHLVAAGFTLVEDGAQEAVVTGCVVDPRSVDAPALAAAIGSNLWLATNVDATVPTRDGPIPDTGAILELLLPLVGREPEVCGKPSAWMLDAVRATGARTTAAVVIGDGVATDLAWARANAWPCIHIAEDPAGGDITATSLMDLLA